MGSFSTSSCLPWHWHWKDLLNLEPTSKASIPSPNFKPKASTFNNPNPQPGLNSNPFSRNGSPLHEQPSRLPKSPKFQSSTPTLAQRNAHITHRRRHQSNPPPEPKISGFPGPNHSGSGDTPCGTPRSTSLQPELPPEPGPAAAGMGTKGGLGLAGRLKCQPPAPASFLPAFGEFGDVLRPTYECDFIVRGRTARLCSWGVQNGTYGVWHCVCVQQN